MSARLPPFFALRALEAAARHRSYSRAADELGVTHSAVSQQIRTLQAELGAQLFDRCGNHMEPTPEASRLAGEVARAIRILQGGVGAFATAVADEPLVLSIGGFMARRWLPPRLPRLMADPAGAGLQLQVVDRHVDFFREQVDAAIRYGTGQWPGLEGRRLYSEDMYPVCTPQFAQARGIRRVEDIVGAPLLHLRSRPWSIWLEKFGVEGSPASEIWFDDSLLLMEAAAQGLGMALVVEGMVHEELQAGRLVRPLGETHAAGVDVYMVWRPDSPKLSRIQALRDWLTDEIEGRHGPAGGQAA